MKIDYCFSLLFAVVFLTVTNGCTPKDPLPNATDYSSYNINVPFISPRSKLCASTSIEMVSSYWESKTSYLPYLSQEELDKWTLIPEKGGTLQIEFTSAARANGLIVYRIEPTFDALFSELAHNHPVIVLLNRSFSWYPLWHYATVTGYDSKRKNILTHFAETPHEPLSITTFAALWERSDKWGVVLLPPGYIPASASAKKFLRSAYDLEKTGMMAEAITAYKSALVRWPEDIDTLFALANAYYRSDNLSKAELTYKKLLALEPTHPLANNNLADLLCNEGKSEEALKVLDNAITGDIETESIIKATRKEINMKCQKFNVQKE